MRKTIRYNAYRAYGNSDCSDPREMAGNDYGAPTAHSGTANSASRIPTYTQSRADDSSVFAPAADQADGSLDEGCILPDLRYG